MDRRLHMFIYIIPHKIHFVNTFSENFSTDIDNVNKIRYNKYAASSGTSRFDTGTERRGTSWALLLF